MKVYLISQSNKAESLFSTAITRLSFPLGKKKTKEASKNEIYYFHLESFTERKLQNLVKELSSIKQLRWGIIDSETIVTDPAALFHQGACDYIGTRALPKSIDEERLERLSVFYSQKNLDKAPSKLQPKTESKKKKTRTSSFPGWNSLIAGKKYDFIALLVMIDKFEEFRNKIGLKNFEYLKEVLQIAMKKLAQEGSGVLWIDDGQGFLLLFPPKKMEKVLFLALDFLAQLRLFSFEQCKLGHDVLSVSFSLHKANLPWQKPGKTDRIISDELNFIYHLGKHFTPSTCFDLCYEVFAELSTKVQKVFTKVGKFEEKEVYRFWGLGFHKPSLLAKKNKDI